jgi:carbamate kinase
MDGPLVVVALGGNAIKQPNQKGTCEEQFHNIDQTAQQLAEIVQQGYRLVITHGNGPQAGALLIQQEEAADSVPPQTLSACGAMTQGQIGWMIQNRISYYLRKKQLHIPCCSLITQVLVDKNDADFDDPSKPVGPFYTEEEAHELQKRKGYIVKEVSPGREKPWRRVVPSPQPVDVLEKEIIRKLVTDSTIVVASGGGGIPVIAAGDEYIGIDAVIDKDRAGLKLAQCINADTFLILTDVEQVYINYNSESPHGLNHITVEEAEQYWKAGHFQKGSMAPKVESCINFTKWSHKKAIISSLDCAIDALQEKAGTHFHPVEAVEKHVSMT